MRNYAKIRADVYIIESFESRDLRGLINPELKYFRSISAYRNLRTTSISRGSLFLTPHTEVIPIYISRN